MLFPTNTRNLVTSAVSAQLATTGIRFVAGAMIDAISWTTNFNNFYDRLDLCNSTPAKSPAMAKFFANPFVILPTIDIEEGCKIKNAIHFNSYIAKTTAIGISTTLLLIAFSRIYFVQRMFAI